MTDWARMAILNATKQYSDVYSSFPKAYDPGNNMGNATYGEMLDYFDVRRKQLAEEVAAFMQRKKHKDDVWEKRAQVTQQVLDQLPKFGYETLDYNNDYFYLYNDRERLGKMFYYKFGRMRMAYNTPTEFNYQLQAIFNNIADDYNTKLGAWHAFRKQFFDDTGDIKGKLKENIDFNELSKSDIFGYPDNQQPSRHITTSEMRGYSVKNKINNMNALYFNNQRIIKDYLNEFYPLFDTIEYATGGYVIE